MPLREVQPDDAQPERPDSYVRVYDSPAQPPATRADTIDLQAIDKPGGLLGLAKQFIGWPDSEQKALMKRLDLDTEARRLAEEIGLNMVRAATVGTHPEFVRMIRELITERLDPAVPRRTLGTFGPSHDVCPADCCLSGMARPGVRPASV